MIAVDFVEGGGGCEGQLVGGKADHGAVLLMEVEHLIVNIPLDLLDDLGDV